MEDKHRKEINKNMCYNCGLSIDLTDKDYPVCDECSKENFQSIDTFVKTVNESIPDINRVNDKIYLGSKIVADKKEFLQDFGIKEIIICSTKLKLLFPKDFKYYMLFKNEIIEKFDLIDYLDDCYTFIDECEKVLIYCESGNSLSAAVVLGYLIFKCEYSFEKALELLRQNRKGITLSDKYVQEIKALTKELND